MLKVVLIALAILIVLVILVVAVGYAPRPSGMWRAVRRRCPSPGCRLCDARGCLALPGLAERRVAGWTCCRQIRCDGASTEAPATSHSSSWNRCAPVHLLTKIDDRSLAFGGTWSHDLVPSGTGTTVTITERGEVYNPLFRFMSRFVFGHTATMEGFLGALAVRMGELTAVSAGIGDDAEPAKEQAEHHQRVVESRRLEVDVHVHQHAGEDDRRSHDRQQPADDRLAAVVEEKRDANQQRDQRQPEARTPRNARRTW